MNERRLRFVLCLFAAAVLLPTACVLWLINDSISKQRQLTRQQLADAYRSQLKVVGERLDDFWRNEALKLADRVKDGPTAAVWAAVVNAKLVDSLILYNANGQVAYPSALQPAATTTPDTVALAAQAEARSLRQAGDKAKAASIIFERFLPPGLDSALDSQARSIAGDALLMAIQLTPASDPRRTRAAERLSQLLNDYSSNPMPSAQRVFLMKEMLALKLGSFPTLDAEDLAIRLVESGVARAFDGVLRPSGMKDVWTVGSNTGQIVGLLRTASVKKRIEDFISAQPLSKNVRLTLIQHSDKSDTAIDAVPVGAYLPEWRIALLPANEQPFEELASRQMGLYVWAGALVVIAVAAIAVVAGRAIHRQMRLANLKSDLVATVSHELKTPLASIRLLLDTLLQSDGLEPKRTREYLELMDRESTRLTQMIENFLAFSRLERNRYNFRFSEVNASEVVDRAMDAFAERAAEPKVHMNVNVAPDLPLIHADAGALSTVLLNLLDNAYKYTPDQKKIDLRAFQNNGHVCFEVQDNGIGVPKSEATKVFRDFYQVDSRLSRTQGGCGLGLSIVKFIVQAHKGAVSLDSRAGEGATFKVEVPCVKS